MRPSDTDTWTLPEGAQRMDDLAHALCAVIPPAELAAGLDRFDREVGRLLPDDEGYERWLQARLYHALFDTPAPGAGDGASWLARTLGVVAAGAGVRRAPDPALEVSWRDHELAAAYAGLFRVRRVGDTVWLSDVLRGLRAPVRADSNVQLVSEEELWDTHVLVDERGEAVLLRAPLWVPPQARARLQPARGRFTPEYDAVARLQSIRRRLLQWQRSRQKRIELFDGA